MHGEIYFRLSGSVTIISNYNIRYWLLSRNLHHWVWNKSISLRNTSFQLTFDYDWTWLTVNVHRSCRPTLAYTDTMAEHKGQSGINSLPARQAASWRRCVTNLAGCHTSPAFTPRTPCADTHLAHLSIISRTTAIREFITSRISLKTAIRENSPSRILLIPQYT